MNLSRAIIITVTVSMAFSTPTDAADALKLVGSVALEGVEGRMDHLAYDPATKRVFVSALENRTVEVIDLEKRQRIHTITGVSEPQGIIWIPDASRLLVCHRGDGTCRSFDGATFKEGPWIDWGRNADNIRFDPATRTVFVGSNGEPGTGLFGAISLDYLLPVDGGGKASPPHSPADFRFEEPRQSDPGFQIPLASHPESFQFDAANRRFFVNVPDEHEVTVLDVKDDGFHIAAHWPVTAGEKNFPMTFAADRSRLFVACRRPPFVVSYDTMTGKALSQTACVGDADDMFFDAASGQLIVIGGEGFVDVFQTGKSGDELTRTQHLATTPRARTGTYIAETRTLCVAVPHTPEHKAELLIYQLSP